MNGKEKTAREFGRILAADEGPPSLAERMAVQRQNLIEMTAAGPGMYRRPTLRKGVGVAAALSAVAASLVLYVALAPSADSMIPFFIGESLTPEPEGRFLSTGKGERTVIRFDGGSRFELVASTEARVVKASGETVTIDLAQGTVQASVNPESRRQWTVRAGPYAVVVKGTIFAVNWDNASAILSVNVERGKVLVTGPGIDGEGVPLAAGSTLKADANAEKVTLGQDDADEALIAEVSSGAEAVETPAETPVEETGEKDFSTKTSRPAPKLKSRLEIARQLYRDKDYVGVLEAGKKYGMLTSMDQLAKDDLWMFANAARYARDIVLSTDYFTLYRERFASSPRARTAAFLLGKTALGINNLNAAKKWFGLYLSEAPTGPLAEEALGHLIDIHSDMGNKTQARRFAKDYLSRYSGGHFSKQAHQVLED